MVKTIANFTARRGHPILAPLIMALVAVGSTVAQVPGASDIKPWNQKASQLCPAAEAADKDEEGRAAHHQSPGLSAALSSEPALWNFVINPSTPYEDRIAAAVQGGSLVPADELPKLWKAFAELEVIPTGVNPSPCEFVWPNAWAARSPQVWSERKQKPIPGSVVGKAEMRTVLGFRTDLPLKAVDYPLDRQGRDNTSWLWQVQRAITALVSSAQKVYSKPDRYPEMAEAGLRWQPENFYEQQIRYQSLTNGPRNGDWIEAMIRLALQEGNGVGNLDRSARYAPDLESLVHAAYIVILQQSKDAKVALAAAAGVALMAREIVSLPPETRYRPTATSILAIANWTTNQKLEPSTRHLFAAELCKSLGEPDCETTLRPVSGAFGGAQSLARFDAWFEAKRPALARQASAEGPRLGALATALHQTLVFDK